MCGRGRFCLSIAQISLAMKNTCVPDINLQGAAHKAINESDFQAYDNFGPGMSCPVVSTYFEDKSSSPSLKRHCCLKFMTWGLIPSFHPRYQKLDHFQMFNARLETVLERKSFQPLISRGRRCVVVFNGYYEWRAENKTKNPYYVYFHDDGISQLVDSKCESMVDSTLIRMAGLFDTWTSSEGEVKETFTILTCRPCSALRPLHDRQPVFLSDSMLSTWLDLNSQNNDDVNQLVRILDSEEYIESFSPMVRWYRVTKDVGKMSYMVRKIYSK